MDNILLDNILLYIVLGAAPGLVWLTFFLRKDKLPEPKIEIIKVFYCAMMVVIPAGMLELEMISHLQGMGIDTTYYLIRFVLIVGLVEEVVKYLIVRYLVLKRSCLDEPIDIVIYMITAGLGFATAENILLFFNLEQGMVSQELLNIITATRFFGANLLHAICSGIIGIFIALSFENLRHRKWIIPLGFVSSILIHGIFDFSIQLFIINNNGDLNTFVPFLITSALAIPLIAAIRKVRDMKSVCKIN
jgi:RsiW-degrading membrane proteinase PrsW (M82 family)